MPRACRRWKVPLKMPPVFPFVSVAAARAVCWLSDRDPDKGAALSRALYRAAFGEGGDITGVENVLAVAEAAGLERESLAAALRDSAVKERLREQVEQSVEKGVVGSPYLIVDGEPFWGHDRLEEVDAWLESGGW